MAKTSKNKQEASANPRSRAAKRATSPSIDVDKSIKNAPRTLGTSPILGVTRNSGIIKKKKSKVMTRGQRARQERGLARAEAVMDQMEKKVDEAKSRLKKRNTRKGQWEDINDDTIDEHRKSIKGPGRNVVEDENQEHENGESTQENEVEMGNALSQAPARQVSSTAQEQLVPGGIQQQPLPHNDEADLIT